MKKIFLFVLCFISFLYSSSDENPINLLDKSSSITVRGPKIMMIGYSKWCINKALDEYTPDRSKIEGYHSSALLSDMLTYFNFPISVCHTQPLNMDELIGFALKSESLNENRILDEDAAYRVSHNSKDDDYDLYNLNAVFFKAVLSLVSERLDTRL